MNRESIEKKFNSSRSNLLLVTVLTAVNVILTLMDSDVSFLFAANLPAFFIELGGWLFEETGIQLFFIMGTMAAFAGIALYALCYILSKKYKAWILVALIIFPIDTLLFIYILTQDFGIDLLIGLGFHAWIIFCLASGVKAWSDLKKLPPDEPTDQDTDEQQNEDEQQGTL